MASYPDSIFNPPVNQDNVTVVDAAYMNTRDEEITAIEQALGIGLVPNTSAPLANYLKVVGPAPNYDLALVPSGGKVGVGTTTPEAKLHVVGEALFENNNAIRWKDTAGVHRRYLLLTGINEFYVGAVDDGGSAASVFSGTGAPIKFYPGYGAEQVRIQPNGNVGIGTTSPTARLDIDADTIRIRRFAGVPGPTDGNPGDVRLVADGSAHYIYVKIDGSMWKKAVLTV
jgi:hypothetical protein